MQMVEPTSSSYSPSAPLSTMTSKVKHNTLGVNGHASSPAVKKASSHPPSEEDAETQSLNKLLEVSVIVLRQAIDLVNDSLTDDAQLTHVSKFIPGSTIGRHLRHATDHFSLLLDSLSYSSSNSEPSEPRPIPAQRNDGNEVLHLELNYDVRARGTPMESSRAAARGALESCIARLQRAVPAVERDRMVKLTAVTPFVQTFRTSFGRELWFAALHAVHHWSMVRVIAGELGIQLEDSFGVAPSTLVYRGSEGPLGKAKI